MVGKIQMQNNGLRISQQWSFFLFGCQLQIEQWLKYFEKRICSESDFNCVAAHVASYLNINPEQIYRATDTWIL